MLKDDLVTALDTHLRANSAKLSADKLFTEYYERSGSPAKKGRPTEDGKDSKDSKDVKEKEPKRRKTVAAKQEPSSP